MLHRNYPMILNRLLAILIGNIPEMNRMMLKNFFYFLSIQFMMNLNLVANGRIRQLTKVKFD